MEPKIRTRITNLIAKLAGSPDYDPRVKPKFPIEFYLEKYIKEPIPKISVSANLLDGEQYNFAITKNAIDRVKTTGLAQVYVEDMKTTYTCNASFFDDDEGITLSYNRIDDVNDFPASGAESLMIRIEERNGEYRIAGRFTVV